MVFPANPVLTGYFCEDFSSKNTRCRLLLRKGGIRPNNKQSFQLNCEEDQHATPADKPGVY